MTTLVLVLSLSSLVSPMPQFGGFGNFFRPLENFLRPVMRFLGGGPRFVDDGTQSPQATGRDKLFPDDCGRDEDKGTGKLCFPDGKLCEERKSTALYIEVPVLYQLLRLFFPVVPTN